MYGFYPVREWNKTKHSHEQDTKEMSAPTLLPTISTEKDFAVSTSGSCFKPLLAHAIPTDNDVLRSKVEALAGGPVCAERKRCFEFAIVREIASALVDELSKPKVQQKLQMALLAARKSQQRIRGPHAGAFYGKKLLRTDGNENTVPGRCELYECALEDVLFRMDMSRTSTADVWNVIARFAYDEEVVSSLSTVDELLALPPTSTMKALLMILM